MKSYLDKIFILEGILLAIIGVLFFINPVNAFFNFTTICGILIIIAGILRIIRAFGTDSKMYYILTGIIDILFGFIIWFNPISTTETLTSALSASSATTSSICTLQATASSI